jgi:methylmalonyl-CoA mutase
MEELFSEFREISFKEWKNKANYDLGGKDFNQNLNWHGLEGINTPPYFSSDSKIKSINHNRTTDSNFKVAKTFILKDDVRSSNILRSVIEEEFDSIKLFIPKGYNLENLLPLENLYSKNIQFEFESFNEEYLSTINTLSIRMNGDNIIYLNLDFINKLAIDGDWIESELKDFDLLKKVSENLSDNIIPFSINTVSYQNSGANIVQQIAYSLAIAVEYANILGKDFFSKVQYNFAFGSNFFFEIAKISAFDYLIDLIKSKYDVKSENIICGESSLRNKTIYDAHNNILRSTTEAFSAIISGVNSFISFPFDYTYNAANKFSGRIAYNQLLILKEEAYINKVDNISEGSYYLDFIKAELAEKSLDIFKQIEKGGGFLLQLKDGVIQRKVNESAVKEQKMFDKGLLHIVGSNSYENKVETMDSFIRKYPFQKYNHRKTIINCIYPKRLSEDIEKLRLKLEKE